VPVGTDVAVGATGVLGTTGAEPSAGAELAGGAELVVDDELVPGVELVAVAAPRCRLGWERVRVGVLATGGASRLPAASGSEERPMCWLVSWLVAQVIPAASAMPSSAASAHRAA